MCDGWQRTADTEVRRQSAECSGRGAGFARRVADGGQRVAFVGGVNWGSCDAAACAGVAGVDDGAVATVLLLFSSAW